MKFVFLVVLASLQLTIVAPRNLTMQQNFKTDFGKMAIDLVELKK